MTLTSVVVSAAVLVALFALWWTATRRHLDRRQGRRREWDGAEGRSDLWTSGARCPSCGETGGLLEVESDELWFVCLSCRARHRRETRA